VHNSVQYVYLFLFSACFGHPCAHHQEKITVIVRHWYLWLCIQSEKYQRRMNTVI